MKRYPSLGVTGGLGCGKSEVGRILSEAGADVLDADLVAHELLRDNRAVQEAVTGLCGPQIRGADGQLNRKAIAAQVFAEPAKRKALEAILHPRIWDVVRRWRSEQEHIRPGVVLIPLLFEADLTSGWDAVWCVAASDALVNERLRERGWSNAQIESRRHAQWPIEEKIRRADTVIHNDGSREALKKTVLDYWEKLLERSR